MRGTDRGGAEFEYEGSPLFLDAFHTRERAVVHLQATLFAGAEKRVNWGTRRILLSDTASHVRAVPGRHTAAVQFRSGLEPDSAGPFLPLEHHIEFIFLRVDAKPPRLHC